MIWAIGALLATMASATQAAQPDSSTPEAAACVEGANDASCETQAPVPGPFIVFFPWGGSDIDQDGHDIVAATVSAYAEEQGLQILLSGHSDRSGPAAVNERIARQRAVVVRDALVAEGIPADVIQIEVRGESALLIGTRDGEREAQNRRVEILFSRAR